VLCRAGIREWYVSNSLWEASGLSQPQVYQLGPVRIRSALPLPFSKVDGRAVDAELFLSQTFPSKSQRAEHDFLVSWEGSRAWIGLHESVDAFVSDGTVVCIDPRVAGDPNSPAVWAALAVLLLQRGMLLLHGAAVAEVSGATVFLGPSGAGKSTAACYHALQGATFLSDDLVPLFCNQSGIICTFQFDRISALVPRPHPDAEWISEALLVKARGVRFDGKKRFEVGEGDSTITYPIENTVCLGPSGSGRLAKGTNEASPVAGLMYILDSLACAPLNRANLGRKHLEIASRLVEQTAAGGRVQQRCVKERGAISQQA
jgi:hypothetical protein